MNMNSKRCSSVCYNLDAVCMFYPLCMKLVPKDICIYAPAVGEC